MNILEHIEKLKPEHYVVSVLGFVALFSPGVLAVVNFFPEFFMEIGAVKLVFLGLSVGIPATIPHVLGSLILVWNYPFKIEQKVRILPFLSATFGLFFSVAVSYFVIFMAYILGLGLKVTICLYVGMHCISVIFWVAIYKDFKKRHGVAA